MSKSERGMTVLLTADPFVNNTGLKNTPFSNIIKPTIFEHVSYFLLIMGVVR